MDTAYINVYIYKYIYLLLDMYIYYFHLYRIYFMFSYTYFFNGDILRAEGVLVYVFRAFYHGLFLMSWCPLTTAIDVQL